MADNGGSEPGLTGHDFTNRQLFWIQWGQVWCSKYRTEKLQNQILTGYHSPGPYRINGPLSNSEDFAKSWNCPAGSRMNPTDKCVVW